MPRINHISKLIVFILSIVFLISGCKTQQQTVSSEDSSADTISEENANQVGQLDCEIKGYPCTVSEVSQQVLESSQQALDETVELIEEGRSIEDAAEALRERGDLAELIYEPEGIRFRLEGGMPMWVINAEAVLIGSKAPGGGKSPRQEKIYGPAFPILQSGNDDGPIGESERGEEPYKKALLLSPFWWDFEGDETELLKALMEKSHRNYNCEKCDVVLKKNTVPDKTDEESVEVYEFNKTLNIQYGVTLEDFKNWDQFDLIHVSTHGIQVCGEASCEAMLMTGQFLDVEDYLSAVEFSSPEPGIVWGKMAVPGCDILMKEAQDASKDQATREKAAQAWGNKGCGTFTNRYWQLIEPDFFTYTFQGEKSLDDKMIYFSACESMKDLSLAKAVSGENTTVYGWTEAVDVGSGANVAIKFYELYVVEGVRAEVAFGKVKDMAADEENNPVLRRYQPKGIEIVALLPPEFEQEGEENTRGREIITLMQPIYRVELQERDAIPISGIAGDGENDQLLFHIQIDGIDENQDPKQFMIHLAVDGEELQETFKPQEKIGEYSFKVVDLVDLPFDASTRDKIELEAWVDLPEGGQSRHVLEEVELAKCGWTGSMSGARNGPVKGGIVIPTKHLASVDLEEFTSLAGSDALGPLGEDIPGMPPVIQPGEVPIGVFMGSGQNSGQPFFMIFPGIGATGIFNQTEMASGQQADWNLTENSDERIEGSFSGNLVDILSQSNFSVQGEVYWHIQSLCSLDVIFEIAQNPLPINPPP